jgi:hypothetical protein
MAVVCRDAMHGTGSCRWQQQQQQQQQQQLKSAASNSRMHFCGCLPVYELYAMLC